MLANAVMMSPAISSLSGDVFVSYASADTAVANGIVADLEKQGVRCWLAPRDVRPGTEYADAIIAAINEAKAVVLVLSGSAVASSHVGREIERAASKHKQIIAFRLDTAPLSRSFEYFLSNSQWINVPALGMPAALVKLQSAVGQGPSNTADPRVPAKPVGKTRRIAMAAAAVVGVGLSVALGLHFWSSKPSGAKVPASAAVTDKSIAVTGLPESEFLRQRRIRQTQGLNCWNAPRMSNRLDYRAIPPETSMRWAFTQRLSSESNEAIIGPMSSG
jgi:hypothetical protein